MLIYINRENFPKLTIKVVAIGKSKLKALFIKGYENQPMILPPWVYRNNPNFNELDVFKYIKKYKLGITELQDNHYDVVRYDDDNPVLCIVRFD